MNNAREFLDYVAKNEKRLKKNLMKNITFDEDIFDDVFQRSIIKVYDSIVKNDKIVTDFEQYFFISSKFEYILQDNRSKKKKNNFDNIEEVDWLCDEEYRDDSGEISELLDELKNYLRENYGLTNSNIMLSYFAQKADGKCSYRQIAEEFDVPLKVVVKYVNALKNDEEVNNIFYKKFKSIKEI